jgi:hypothetical protein
LLVPQSRLTAAKVLAIFYPIGITRHNGPASHLRGGLDMYGWNVNIAPQPLSPGMAKHPSSAMPSEVRRGIVRGTLVASDTGWRAVEELAVGDRVQTFDNGMQQIVQIRRELLRTGQVSSSDHPWRVVLPAGAMNGTSDITLLPQQGVLLESENACDAMGDPLAVVPAQVLVGISGIRAQPIRETLQAYRLIFASEEVIYADAGLLLHCPAAALPAQMKAAEPPLYDVKTLAEAKAMLTDLDIAQLMLDDMEYDILEPSPLENVA